MQISNMLTQCIKPYMVTQQQIIGGDRLQIHNILQEKNCKAK
jgi:hypothetical protein